MKKISNLWLVAVMMFITTTIFAQVSGNVSDESGPLADVNVKVKGTDKGTVTDFDGNFTIKNAKTGILVVSYLGYTTKEVPFKTGDKVNISLQNDGESLGEIVISGIVDIAKDRQTPVAVSTIKAVEIIDKLGSQEFPEMLNSTPSVYATKSGGGFGDARINIRGFDQTNIAVMINGMPVNDMENGKVYWSNWAGLSDVTTAMQVQRGLGSSKLPISSAGGTINILTNTADKKQGGSVRIGMGNDGYQKYLATYSTGLLESGLSASVLLSRTTGDGYIDGTKFEGHNYFIGLGYKINDNNKIQFTFTGAPQWHHQNYKSITIDNYIKYSDNGEPNRKYNEQWGYLNGEEYTWRRNFYHKPIMSLNWDLNLGDNSKVATVVYGSWGRGGGSGPIGNMNGIWYSKDDLRDSNGQIRFDDIATWNSGGHIADFGADKVPNGDGNYINDNVYHSTTGLSRRNGVNSHDWYGIVSSFHNDLTDKFSWDLGIDARTYKGSHYQVMNDVIGADGFLDTGNVNNPNHLVSTFYEATPSFNPWVNIKDQEKISYYNEGNVRWLGAFGQAEYKTEKVSTFVQFGFSNQAFKRVDYFNYLDSDSEQASDWEALNGYNVKGGLNYNLTDKHNVFFNTGYNSKQPMFRAVYPNYSNNDINTGLTNEKIFGVELGYGYKTENYRFNANVYRTSWKDRFLRSSGSFDTTGDGNDDTDGTANLSGIEEIHSGIEFEGTMRFGKLKLEGMASFGNWEYNKDVTATFFDDNNHPIIEAGETEATAKTLYLEGKKVGDAAQMTAKLGLSYEILEGLNFDISQRYAGNLYARIDASGFRNEDTESLKLPGYSLIDTGLSYKYKLKNKSSIKLRLNVNNLMDKLYISESTTNYHPGDKGNDEVFNGVNTKNKVWFGFGRTWNATLSFNF